MNRLLDLAAEFARMSRDDGRTFRLAALAVRQDGVIVVSPNGPSPGREPACHAEARALRKAGAGATLYVARVRRDGTPALARPCPTCMRLIRAKRVRRVFWTEDCSASSEALNPRRPKIPVDGY